MVIKLSKQSENEIKSMDREINDPIRIKPPSGRNDKVTATCGLERIIPDEFDLRSVEFPILKWLQNLKITFPRKFPFMGSNIF